ncbi:hypothetical protein [Amycolatopsis keratiniphila]|uniref:hypothetical protein n=1 Tax=Amycolatopsis keratiniphila TaxID=129921 RepID=UPI00087CCB84|nr:hypothetical protein [Amycolatopsis keratiniphila]OLZ47259.1 hypothetical protein BS330_34915 [Amycolatopsis keratiniphila subsp. nogabecina]SDU38656.1 hypothetical protein SAMN04489733_3638 [Amycolatopsis keratiniphila]
MTTTVQRTTAAEALREAEAAPGTGFPCLLPGISLIPTRTGMVAFGAAQPQVFGGKAAHTVLPTVLRAMDGTRGTSAIAELLGLPVKTVDAVHALARSRDLLCSGPVPGDHSGRWLARSGTATAKVRDADSGDRRGTRVKLTGDPVLTAELGELLALDGVRAEVVDRAGCTDSDLVLVVLNGEEPTAELAALDRELTAAGVPWLRVLVHEGGAEVGPRFAPRDELRYDGWWPVNPPPAAAAPASPGRDAALGFAALEIVNLLSGAGRPVSMSAVAEFDVADGSYRRRPRAPRPGDGESLCLALDHVARQSIPDGRLPRFLLAPEPDPAAIEPVDGQELTRLLGAAFPGGTDRSLNAYVLGEKDRAHLYLPEKAGLIDLAGVADVTRWRREHAGDAFAVIAVSVTVPAHSNGTTVRDGLLHTGAAVQRLLAAAAGLGLRTRDGLSGSLGDLGDALGLLPHAETLLEIVVLDREPGDER